MLPLLSSLEHDCEAWCSGSHFLTIRERPNELWRPCPWFLELLNLSQRCILRERLKNKQKKACGTHTFPAPPPLHPSISALCGCLRGRDTYCPSSTKPGPSCVRCPCPYLHEDLVPSVTILIDLIFALSVHKTFFSSLKNT